MTSERELTQLSAYLDGELSPPERAEVEQRLASDPAARSALQALERTQTLIATTMEDVDLTVAVQTRVNAIEPGGSGDRSPYLLPSVAAAVALVAAAVGYTMLSGPAPDPATPATPVTAEPDPATIDSAPLELAEPVRPTPRATEPAPPIEPAETLPAAARAMEVPIEAFFDLPEADAPYSLLAVDTGQRPPLAYIELHHNKRAAAVREGEALPDDRLLAWAGDSGVIVGEPGDWRRLTAPVDEYDSLAGIWQVETWVDGQSYGQPLVASIEDSPQNGAFRIPAVSIHGASVRGTRQDTRLEVRDTGRRAELTLTGSTGRGYTEFDLNGALVRTVADGDDGAPREIRSNCTVRARRLTHLERSQVQHRWSQYEDGLELVNELRLSLLSFFEREERLPRDAAELLAEFPEAERGAYEAALRWYDPIPLDLEPIEPMPRDMRGDPDLMYQHEMDLIARFGMEVPLPVVILEASVEETGDRMGVSVWLHETEPYGALRSWSRRGPDYPNAEDPMLQSEPRLREIESAFRRFANDNDGYYPPGWWSILPHYLNNLDMLTHPSDEPGALSYDFFLPGVNVRRMLEDMHGGGEDDPLTEGEVRELMAQVPVAADDRPWGQPPGRHVLFANGEVDWLPEPALQQLLREWFR